ncbi:unnamed protein product [Gadus morhua 'NCC']
MSCIPATHSTVPVVNPAVTKMEEMPRRGSRVYQLFPESPALTDSDSGSFSEEMNYHRERLPSIVLEPTEQSEGEGEEEGARDGGENTQEGDACGDQETGERQKEMESSSARKSSIGSSSTRKSSIGPVQDPMSSSRLTPPPSPTSPETAPPCLRS